MQTDVDNQDALFRTGKGHWNHFSLEMDTVFRAAENWKNQLEGSDKLWLCWNVDPDWCLIQQKLVANAGWTPLVGGDPRAEKAKLLKESVYVDFNQGLNLPMVHMLFPVEFAFLFAKKLAFWHSDLLVREHKVQFMSQMFDALVDGDMAVTNPARSLKMKILKQVDRYWELAGCTTAAASRHQYEVGSGWFGHVACHPNSPESEFKKKSRLYYDHGSGIKYWAKNHKPESSIITFIDEKYLDEGHCTRIRRKNYIAQSPNNAQRDLSKDLSYNFDLKEECNKLSLTNVFNSVITSDQK